MKLSLRTFIVLAIFIGITVGVVVRRIHLNTPHPVPMSYAVINATKRISDNYPPPTQMIMWRKPMPNPIAVTQDTSFHWIVHDIDQQKFVDFLNKSQVGKTIQLDDVYQQIDKNGRPTEEYEDNDLFGTKPSHHGYSAREFAFHALEAAGVGHECNHLSAGSYYLDELLAMINQHSVGVSVTPATAANDHRIWLAPKYTPPTMQVTFAKRTIELNIFADQTHPILIAEALNTMLAEFTDYEHRFYAYIWYVDGWDEHCVAYLKPEVAAKLEKDFGLIPFPL